MIRSMCDIEACVYSYVLVKCVIIPTVGLDGDLYIQYEGQ